MEGEKRDKKTFHHIYTLDAPLKRLGI